jgi:glycosyltransferase involved in cell wall biosynthesis
VEIPTPRFPDYAPALHSLVNELGIADKVTFYGKVSDPQSWYAKIDIFISNSYSEGLQVSPMEAIATGCYCLSHQWDGANELLPEENLFYSDLELTQKISAYCDVSEADRREMVAALMALVRERFDVDKTKILIREIVEEIGNHHLR